MTNPVGYEGHELDAAAAVLEDLETAPEIYLATIGLSAHALAAAVGAMAVTASSAIDPTLSGLGLVARTMTTGDMRDDIAITTGRMEAVGVGLKAGQVVTKIWHWCSQAATSPTLARYVLFKSDFVEVAASVSDTSVVLSTGRQGKNLSSPYEVPVTGLYYPALLVKATDAGKAAGQNYNFSSTQSGPMDNGSYETFCQTGLNDIPATAVPAITDKRLFFELT